MARKRIKWQKQNVCGTKWRAWELACMGPFRLDVIDCWQVRTSPNVRGTVRWRYCILDSLICIEGCDMGRVKRSLISRLKSYMRDVLPYMESQT